MSDARAGIHPVIRPRPEAIVVTCSDPRFQPAFDGLVADLALAEGRSIRIAIAGGGWTLLNPFTLPTKDFTVVKDCVELHRRGCDAVRRLILVIHDDCIWYQHAATKPGFRGKPDDRSLGEYVGDAVAILAVHLGPALAIEVYRAGFHDDAHTQHPESDQLRGDVRGDVA